MKITLIILALIIISIYILSIDSCTCAMIKKDKCNLITCFVISCPVINTIYTLYALKKRYIQPYSFTKENVKLWIGKINDLK